VGGRYAIKKGDKMKRKDLPIHARLLREARRELRELHYTMFEYGNLPDTVDPLAIEAILQNSENKNGMIAWWKLRSEDAMTDFPEGSLIVSKCSLGNNLDPYGRGLEVIATTENGISRTFKSRFGDDVVVGYNNFTRRPCDDIEVDAETLSEIDLSIRYMIFFTRLYPVFKCVDEKERDKILTIFNNMEVGKPLTLIDKKLLADLGVDTSGVEMANFTNPELANNIQYISKLREDVLRWHHTKYGQSVNGNSKMAQQTVDEVNGTVSASLIIPLSMLEARRKMIDEVNAKFGTDITVDFSGAWRAEVTKYEQLSGEEDIDGTPEEVEEDEERKEGDTNEDREESTDGGDKRPSDDNDAV
jgi:hypothetical protein